MYRVAWFIMATTLALVLLFLVFAFFFFFMLTLLFLRNFGGVSDTQDQLWG